jgi:glutathione S-transferase
MYANSQPLHIYYSQKVWLTLEEKKIPYRVEKVNMSCYGSKPSEFLRLQPSGQIPVAIIDGTVYGQSNDILLALEDRFPEYKALKCPPQESGLLRLERQLFSAWMSWLTSGSGKRLFVELLQVVETELSKRGPFFLGNDISMVDVQFAPFLERMAASLLYYKGFQMRVAQGETTRYPALNKWFDAMETLESYQLVKSDYYTHCWDLPPQLGGCVSEREGELHQAAINGEKSLLDKQRGSWILPLEPHNGGIEPDWTWAGDDGAARREAVERITANYNAITRFAARGAGKKGVPPVRAPLADPNATPNEAVLTSVDVTLRVVCQALLDGVEQHASEMNELASTFQQKGDKQYVDGVVASLEYIRDRVGVPRDMRLPAARHLRAHLNWAIDAIVEQKR